MSLQLDGACDVGSHFGKPASLQAASPSVSACCGIRVMLISAADQAESSNTEKQQQATQNIKKRGLHTVFLFVVPKVGDKPSASAAVGCLYS